MDKAYQSKMPVKNPVIMAAWKKDDIKLLPIYARDALRLDVAWMCSLLAYTPALFLSLWKFTTSKLKCTRLSKSTCAKKQTIILTMYGFVRPMFDFVTVVLLSNFLLRIFLHLLKCSDTDTIDAFMHIKIHI